MKRTSIHRSAAALASVALLAGCSGQTNESPGAAGSLQGGKTDANSAAVKKGGTATYSVNVDVKNWNVLTSSGDVYGYRQILNPVYPHAMISQPDFTMAPNKALLTSAELTGTSPQVVTYKIRPEAVWSDGTPISAADFEYTWKVQDPAQCGRCQAV